MADAGLAGLRVNLEIVVDEAHRHQHAEHEPQCLQDLENKLPRKQSLKLTLAKATGAMSGT